MTKFSSSDVIQALVTCRGMLLGTMRLTGFDNMRQLISHLINTMGLSSGLFNISLRNTTEGWTMNHAICLR